MGTQEAEDLILSSRNSTLTGESLVEDSGSGRSVGRLRRGWRPYGFGGQGAVALAGGQCSRGGFWLHCWVDQVSNEIGCDEPIGTTALDR